MNATATTTRAAEAAAGGAIIGVAVGTYMLELSCTDLRPHNLFSLTKVTIQ